MDGSRQEINCEQSEKTKYGSLSFAAVQCTAWSKQLSRQMIQILIACFGA